MDRSRLLMVIIVATTLAVVGGCVKPIDGVWSNGFDAKTAGFEKISIFSDVSVVSLTPRGEEFLWISESIQNARAMDETLSGILKSKGYSIGTHERFFIGAWCENPYPTSFAMSRRTLMKDPPYHVDPGIARLDGLTTDIREAFTQFALMIAQGQSAMESGSLPPEVAARIAGNYKSSGFALVLSVVRQIETEAENMPELSAENMQAFKSAFVAVGYFEGMTGKLVYSNILPLEAKKKTNPAKTLARFHENFPEARVGSRFEVPPPTEYASSNSSFKLIKLDAADDEGSNKVNFSAILSKKGGIPLYRRPDLNYRTEYIVPTGTMVNVIATKSIFSKVVLPDGTIGWVSTDAVWVRK